MSVEGLGEASGPAEPGRADLLRDEVGRPQLPESKRIKLLYIVGHHKSGATALGGILAGNPEIFYVGELYRFPSPIWVPGDPQRLCSCGAPALSCPFWTGVRRAFDGEQLSDPLRKGQQRYERWGSFAGTLLKSRRRDPGLLVHATRMARFVSMIGEQASASVVVESSLSALRGRLYQLVPKDALDVWYLHLVRDGRGFLWSEMDFGKDTEPTPEWVRLPPIIVGRWMGMNLLARGLCGRDPTRYLRVRYEDLVADPAGTLARIGKFLDIDLSAVAAQAAGHQPIPLRHVAAGNRMRLGGAVILRGDVRWRASLPRSARVLFWTMAGWLAWLYGYRLSPGSGNRGDA